MHKRSPCLLLLLVLALPLYAQSPVAPKQWTLAQSTIGYHVSHPLHDTDGISHASRGKAICQADECTLLVAAPVKSFQSGDTNRDLHMIQAVRGAEFPLVTVRTRLPESAIASGTLHADLEIQFNGQTAHFSQVPFQCSLQGNTLHLTGTIPATLADFKITPPAFLMVPLKNEMPIHVDLTWHRQ